MNSNLINTFTMYWTEYISTYIKSWFYIVEFFFFVILYMLFLLLYTDILFTTRLVLTKFIEEHCVFWFCEAD